MQNITTEDSPHEKRQPRKHKGKNLTGISKPEEQAMIDVHNRVLWVYLICPDRIERIIVEYSSAINIPVYCSVGLKYLW